MDDVDFRFVSAGKEHSCAISTKNDIYCWGNDGYNTISETPEGKYAMVASGEHFNCALNKQREGIDCWGYNGYSQVSNAPKTGFYTWVSCGMRTACGVHKESNQIECWGWNGYSQVSQANELTTPVLDPKEDCVTIEPGKRLF